MRTNVVYYNGRDHDLDSVIEDLEAAAARVDESLPIDELMGIEATAKKAYYRSFNQILPSEF
jgi:CRISPR-associated protein Cas1